MSAIRPSKLFSYFLINHSKTAREMRDPGNESGWKLVFLIIVKIMELIKALL